jgi:hypothetical protein
LKDHLAGSVAALELVNHLIETYKGEPFEAFFQNLRDEIDADQETLQDLIKKTRRAGKRGPESWRMGGREAFPREDSAE